MYILYSPEQIAENIIERCKSQNIAVKDLCKAQHVGVNVVYEIRNRKSYPRIDTLFKIASGLGCTIEELCALSLPDCDVDA